MANAESMVTVPSYVHNLMPHISQRSERMSSSPPQKVVPTAAQEPPRSYNYPQCGPWGITLSDELRTQSRLNTAFSQRAWAGAKQDGCLPAPCGTLPTWPPPRGDGFVYPSLSKKPQELLTLGEDNTSGFGHPWASRAPRSAERHHKFWEAGANPNGCPLDQAIGAAGGSAPVYKDLSYAVANRIASEMLGTPSSTAATGAPSGPGGVSGAVYGSQQCHNWNSQ